MSVHTLQEMKETLGIPLDDTSQDPKLRKILELEDVVLEQWLGKPIIPRKRFKQAEEVQAGYGVANTIELIRQGLGALVRHDQALTTAEGQAAEGRYLVRCIEQGEEKWKEDPEFHFIGTRQLAVLKAGDLWCVPEVTWELMLKELRVVRKEDRVFLQESARSCARRELTLSFFRIDHSPILRESFIVEWAKGQKSKSLLPFKKIQKKLAPIARKRLYLSDAIRTPEGLENVLKDLCALTCVHLIQKRLISFDEDQKAGNFLFSYINGFKRAKKVGAWRILKEILSRYLLAEDYRTWRRFIAKTIFGLAKTLYHEEERSPAISDSTDEDDAPSVPSESESTVRNTAEQIGISSRTLYDRIEKEKVPVSQGAWQMGILLEGREAIALWQKDGQRVRSNALFAHALLAKKGISCKGDNAKKDLASATKQIRRWREDYREQEIGEKIGHKWVEKAAKSCRIRGRGRIKGEIEEDGRGGPRGLPNKRATKEPQKPWQVGERTRLQLLRRMKGLPGLPRLPKMGRSTPVRTLRSPQLAG